MGTKKPNTSDSPHRPPSPPSARLYASKRVCETTAIRILAAIEKLEAQGPPVPVTCLSSNLSLRGVGPATTTVAGSTS